MVVWSWDSAGRDARALIRRHEPELFAREDPVRILHDVRVETVEFGPQQRVPKELLRQPPERLTLLDDVRRRWRREGLPLRRSWGGRLLRHEAPGTRQQ